MFTGKVDGVVGTRGTRRSDAVSDGDIERQVCERSERQLLHPVRTNQQDRLLRLHLKGRNHKTTPCVEFCTGQQFRWCPFLLDDQRHLVGMRMTKDGYS